MPSVAKGQNKSLYIVSQAMQSLTQDYQAQLFFSLVTQYLVAIVCMCELAQACPGLPHKDRRVE